MKTREEEITELAEAHTQRELHNLMVACLSMTGQVLLAGSTPEQRKKLDDRYVLLEDAMIARVAAGHSD